MGYFKPRIGVAKSLSSGMNGGCASRQAFLDAPFFPFALRGWTKGFSSCLTPHLQTMYGLLDVFFFFPSYLGYQGRFKVLGTQAI